MNIIRYVSFPIIGTMDYEMGNTVDLKEREPAKAIQTADPRKKQEDAKRCIDIYVAAFQVLDAIPDSAQSYRWDLRLEFETDAGRKGVQYRTFSHPVAIFPC